MKLKTNLVKQLLTFLMVVGLPFIALSASDVKLKLNLNKGDKVKFSSSSEQVITQTINGTKQVINQNQLYEYTIAVTGKEANGNMLATLTFDRVATEIKMQGMEMKFDSNDESDAPLANPQFQILKAMVNQSVSTQLSPQGKVLEINGVDKLREQMAGEGNAQLAQMVKASITDASVKQIFDGAIIEFPEKNLNANDSWTDSKSIEAQYTLNTISTYTVDEIASSEVNLLLSSTLATVPGNKSTIQGMDVTYNLFGTINGTVTIDKKNGYVTASVMEQNINGSFSGDMMGQKLDVPMSIYSKVTTKKIK